MSKTAITSSELTPPVGPFSQAIEVGGFIYFSGQVGQDPTTGKLVAGGIAAETERVFQNLSAVLKAAGKSFDHVACARVFLTNISDYVAMNGIYAKYFSQPFPPRTEREVAGHPSVGTACALVMKQHVRLSDPVRLILEENIGPSR